MTEAAAAINGQRLAGRYRLLEMLGAGGQGEVWRARDDTRGIDVALKVLSPELGRNEGAWAALQHEHAIASRLDHSSILKVYPPERADDAVVLPMELAAGGDLRRLRGAGYLEIIPVLLEVAQALEHAHERGVIHRDLKPGNVLFDARGRVKLADFGVAGTAFPSKRDALSQGLSPFSASPEQLRGEPPTPADDIYGLGALAYELLSGYPPYYPHFDSKHAQEEPVPELVPAKEIPRLLRLLVMRMLAKSPRARPRSMRAVIDELDAALNDTLAFDFEGVVDPARKPPLAVAAAPSASPVETVEASAQPATPPVQEQAHPDPTATQWWSGPAALGGAGDAGGRPGWDDLRRDLRRVPAMRRVARLEPMPGLRRWPLVVLGVLVAAVFAAFYWLPREYAPQSLWTELAAPAAATGNMTPSGPSAGAPAATTAEASADTTAQATLQAARENFDRRLAALEARGAGVWGGADFAAAKTRAAESVGAHDAGNMQIAQQRLDEAALHLDQVERLASQALAAQLEAGEKALAAGRQELATQAFELARRIDPSDPRAADGQRRALHLSGVLPLLADAQNAASSHDFSRETQDYSKALELDPRNATAKSGLARARAAFGDDNYAKAVGAGFAALGAGRVGDARAAFEKARTYRPNGAEAAEGLRRVDAALTARGFVAIRQHAAALEAQERWDEAMQAYDSALKSDPSLVFAQQGKLRATGRAELGRSLQALLDRPERLAAQSVREQAEALLQAAKAQLPSGPVLRSQTARLELLLPEFDKPVRLSLVSDNATQVAIRSIGSFGSFARREIELKPGKYTLIGTRTGYRDVRRDITIAPGQENQTISISCSEPI